MHIALWASHISQLDSSHYECIYYYYCGVRYFKEICMSHNSVLHGLECFRNMNRLLSLSSKQTNHYYLLQVNNVSRASNRYIRCLSTYLRKYWKFLESFKTVNNALIYRINKNNSNATLCSESSVFLKSFSVFMYLFVFGPFSMNWGRRMLRGNKKT